MKLKHFILLSLWSIGGVLTAQEQIRSDLNMFRANDTIVKQQVVYKHPGRQGTDILWDFGKLKTIDNKYTVVYEQTSDSILSGTEHQTRYFYDFRNDSLFMTGHENSTTKMIYSSPELLLRFPIKLGDKAESYYQGNGVYCDKLDIKAYGTSKSIADATGMIILPSGDTLRHVTRVRTTKLISEKIGPLLPDMTITSVPDSIRQLSVLSVDSINRFLQSDTSVLMTDTYRWYAAGYRYPVFETVSTGSAPSHSKTEYFTTAFYFPPNKHNYLKTDKKNASLLVELAEKDKLRNNSTSNSKNNVEGSVTIDNIEFTYNYYPNPVELQLHFEYYLSKDAQVSFGLYGITGLMVYRSPIKSLKTGTYSEVIDMGYCSRGEYILTIIVNNKPFSEKIIKK
ncbi:MAG: T9SS type A sorting domain-containing protein [Bacteroidia bacterium]|nr:T9SS type A sorting domain-containing protein [Bacteroidia bacterium]